MCLYIVHIVKYVIEIYNIYITFKLKQLITLESSNSSKTHTIATQPIFTVVPPLILIHHWHSFTSLRFLGMDQWLRLTGVRLWKRGTIASGIGTGGK